MWKLLFITILCLFISTSNVFSLFCYVSNFESIKLGNLKEISHTIQDCNSYVNQLNGELQIPENVTLHCYTAEVSRDVIIKGCVQSGGCRMLVNTLKSAIQKVGNLDETDATDGLIKCTECNSDHCNAMSPEHLEMRPTASLAQLRGTTSLKCHYCSEPCELATARENICGENIGKSYEAVCSTEISRNSNTPWFAVRKCQVFPKGQVPQCPEDSFCTFCKDDMCNKDTGKKSCVC